jgi:hypothetical protein
LILLPDPDHLAEYLHVETLTLCFGVDVLLVFGEPFDFFLNPLDKGAQLITGRPMPGRSRFRSVLAECGFDPTMMIAGTVGEGSSASVAGWSSSIAAIGLVSASLNEDASAVRTKTASRKGLSGPSFSEG